MTKILDCFFGKINSLEQRYARRKYIVKKKAEVVTKLSKVKVHRKLTPAQKSEIVNFYKYLTGKNISTLDHEYFYSRTGIYTKNYVPMSFFLLDLIGRINRMDLYKAYSDKNLDDVLLPGVGHPHYYLKNINGYYYFEGEAVSKEEAISRCGNLKEVIVKPSLDMQGHGVRKVSFENGVSDFDGHTVGEVFDLYKKDFLIQSAVKQHEGMNRLNPTSVNTIRMATYRSGMEVLLVYAVVRIGRKGQVIDNQSAGGISVKVCPDGTLGKYAFGKSGDDRIEQTDTGVVLDGYPIPSYEKAVETVKKLHYSLPLFDLVGWDISIDEAGEPVLIEWNGKPGPSQTACGTGYGELTERIIKEVWNRPNTYKQNL